MAQVYSETVEVGDPIPTLQKPPVNRTQIARFAAASGDYGPLHVDEEVGRASGYGSVMAHGMIAMGYVGEMLDKWLTNGRLARLDVRFLKLIWPGDVLSAKGVVVPKPEGDKFPGVMCDVWVQNQNNDKVLQGKAFCVLWANPADEKKHGGGKPASIYSPSDYVSPHKKLDMSRASGGTSDKPPQRPPPKAAGTPVRLSPEMESSARADAKKAEAAKAAKPAKVEAKKPEPAKKAEPVKVEAKKAEKPAAKVEAKKAEPAKAAKAEPKKAEKPAAKVEAKKAPAKVEAKKAEKPAAKVEAKKAPAKAEAKKAPAKAAPPAKKGKK